MLDSGLLSQELRRRGVGFGTKNAVEAGDAGISERYRFLMRKAAAEGIVMLKNDGVLPVRDDVISVFGRVQLDYFYVGNGSGGDVTPPYLVNLMQGLDNNPKLKYNKELSEVYSSWCKKNPAREPRLWGDWVTHHKEMPVSDELVNRAQSASDIAVIVIGRCAGEDCDSSLKEGSFCLTKAEEYMLDAVTNVFKKTVLIINSGNIIDFSWYEKYENRLSAILYVWQGGMESGNAICDVLCGDENPSGKLTTAIAARYEDYPTCRNYGGKVFNNYEEDIYVGYRYFETFARDAVLFPFGFGLSYTDFEISAVGDVVEVAAAVCERASAGSGDGVAAGSVGYMGTSGNAASDSLAGIVSPIEGKNGANTMCIREYFDKEWGNKTCQDGVRWVSRDTHLQLNVNVKNIGLCSGAEVIQVYYSAPQGVLGKPSRALAAFYKTKFLAPGEQQNVTIQFPIYYMASYDDSGKTGHKSAYVLEPGEYGIYVGNSVRSAVKAGTFKVDDLIVCCQLEEAAAVDPENRFKRVVARGTAGGVLVRDVEDTPTRTVSLRERILANIPDEITPDDTSYNLSDVAAGKITLEAFVAGLNMDELEGLTRGDYIMRSPLGVPGNAGVFGGVTESLRDKGVIPITTSDGPSGVRLEAFCALLPCGLALSSTWNTELIVELATAQGEELTAKGSHVLLSPGMNILRDPLCGRNFEYYSEDPVLSGKIAAAMVTGLQKYGSSACPKHFAANNQEDYRRTHDSRVSERALREIYLKGFEICIKDSKPRNIMTCYNKINGVWGHYHYELCTTVLRGEWGYEGNVVTDWWMEPSVDPDFPNLHNNAYRVRAQVDVLMPGGKAHFSTKGDGSLLKSYGKKDGITLAEIQRSAMNTLRFVLSVME